MQVWPRKRAARILPSVNWGALSGSGLLGFLAYKVGMASIYAKDITEDSMMKTKKVVIPGTILECPEMKIFSVRFYKNGKVIKDFIVGFDDELKRKVKKIKETKKIDDLKDFDDVRVIVYSDVKKTGVKKNPDIAEIGLGGGKDEKLNWIKEKIGKEISIESVLKQGLVDVRGVSKGKGLQGPVKRFGISLKQYKSEKGRRRPGSLAPWTPSRVTFRTAMAGQMGFHTRLTYNNLILKTGKPEEINKNEGFHKYGKIKTNYIILRGSVPGPKKRVLLLTKALRESKKQSKKKFEILEIR